jgi:hypothetical protein
MLTGPVSGPVSSRYRRVLRPPGGAIADAHSPDGRVMFVMSTQRAGGRWHASGKGLRRGRRVNGVSTPILKVNADRHGWALAFIVVIGVGLPVAARRLRRLLDSRRQPVDGFGPLTDAAYRWLIERHHLPTPQRWQVRQAVLFGDAVSDPGLKEAVRDVAAGVLRGESSCRRDSEAASTESTRA